VIRRARPRRRFRCRSITASARSSPIRYSARGPTLFSKRERVGCEASASPSIGSRPARSFCTGSFARRAASLPSAYPHAIPYTLCATNSTTSWRTRPRSRLSVRPLDNRSSSPTRRSAAFRSSAPPSELLCSPRNWITTGLPARSGNITDCRVVSSVNKASVVAVRPLSTASVTHGGFALGHIS
jgi:hypothetical protein